MPVAEVVKTVTVCRLLMSPLWRVIFTACGKNGSQLPGFGSQEKRAHRSIASRILKGNGRVSMYSRWDHS